MTQGRTGVGRVHSMRTSIEIMAPLFHLCRLPTWTRVKAAVAAAIVTSIISIGCSFEHYPYIPTATDAASGTGCDEDVGMHCESPSTSTAGSSVSSCGGDAGNHCEPACTVSVSLDGGYPDSLVAHWTFDGDGDAWLDSEKGEHTLTLSPGADAATMRYGKTRINGKGSSIALNGSQFAKYTGSIIDPLFPLSQPSPETNGFTISAFISIDSNSLNDAGTSSSARVWPIVSTMTKDSCGYQLDIHWNEGDSTPILAFSYGYQSETDAGNSCQISTIEYPIILHESQPLSAWGMGRWHQITGIYIKDSGSDLATLNLYFDGNRVANSRDQNVEAAPPIHYSDYSLYVGTNAGKSQKFLGYLDEIALFNQPLSDRDLADFITMSTTRPGPSQCRWVAQEYWDNVAPDASTASWESDSTNESAHIVVDDNNWGNGALQAGLTPVKDLRLYDSVYVDATLQADKVFQFQIWNGEGYCEWQFLGKGVRHTYPIDLSNPSYCYASGCEFKLDTIDSISLGSEWTIPPINGASVNNPQRTAGPVDMTLHAIAFGLSPNPVSDWSGYGGAIGPNGWCWRPINYDLLGGARWASDPSAASVSVNLIGPPETSNRIGADFGDNYRHLPENACILIDASSSVPYELSDFAIQDAAGSYGNWDIYLTSSDSPSPCMLQLFDPPSYSSVRHEYPFEKFPNAIDWNRIQFLEIQKPYLHDATAKAPVNFVVRDITIYPDDGQSCKTLANNIRDCTVKPP